ncbi:hypothetical protein E2562_038658 [Oryza meyeriana var. granulata]|uniref:Uncharacterized protein n=1 Tax=Oryza meyeriana var. granulata TaxID=110450 RepID=A0A6G1FGP1_9ORYZ|nr:hypothetical protein E2562_038658 [Oryza meyeriana var. granulata]
MMTLVDKTLRIEKSVKEALEDRKRKQIARKALAAAAALPDLALHHLWESVMWLHLLQDPTYVTPRPQVVTSQRYPHSAPPPVTQNRAANVD